jgi:hypothetical protein
MGKLYAHSPDVEVQGGATYEVSATIDARFSRTQPPCFYIADEPSGMALNMQCARNGIIKRYRVLLEIPYDTHEVQWVAFINNCRIDSDRFIRFEVPDLHMVRQPDEGTGDLLSK